MSNLKKPETTGQINNESQERMTNLVATYKGRYVQSKAGKGQGLKFYKYVITGPKAEIQEFMNSEQFTEYPAYVDGQPMLRLRWRAALQNVGDTFNVKVNYYGNYSLDKEDAHNFEDTMEELSKASPIAAKAFADAMIATKFSKQINTNVLQQLAGQMVGANNENTNMDTTE